MITQAFIPTTKGVLLKYLIYIPMLTWFIFLVGFSNGPTGTIIALVAMVLIFGSFAAYDASRVLPRKAIRDKRLDEIRKQFPDAEITVDTWKLDSPVLNSYRQDGNGRAYSQIKHTNWRLTDYAYDRIVHTRFGDYVSGRCYFTVIELPLPRKVPHVVFDSIHTQGKQMSIKFDDDQKMRLEGNFDNYFDTYYPANYQVDVLSIISPEVMEALIAANAYDIEIYRDRLFVYSTMVNAQEATEMIKKAQTIRTKLLNNIITYADNRLASSRRETVHTYGMTIQSDFKNKAYGLFFVAFICLGIGLFGAIAVLHEFDIEVLLYSVLFIGIAVSSIKSGISIFKNGKRERALRRSVPRQ